MTEADNERLRTEITKALTAPVVRVINHEAVSSPPTLNEQVARLLGTVARLSQEPYDTWED